MTKPDSQTPMMRQYMEQKRRHPDAILLFRMGDFYEMFFDDARTASRLLDIALTTRDKNKETSVPMCGFPHHASSQYISRLLQAGQRVAVCDQVEDPRQAKGIVRREVTRVLTPGLTDEGDTLKADEHNYAVSLATKGKSIGICAFDLSTGDLLVTECHDTSVALQELRRLQPKELIIPERLPEDHPIRGSLDGSFYIHEVEDWLCDPQGCFEMLCQLYGVQNLEGFGLSRSSAPTSAAGIIVNYVKHTRMEAPPHIKTPRVYHLGNYMVLDYATLRNLEIFNNLKDGGSTGALLKLLDRTRTPMGARLLREWLSYPLLDTTEIGRRSEAVGDFVERSITRLEIREILSEMGDLERIAGKISLKSATPRDLVQLRNSCERIPSVRATLENAGSELVKALAEMDDLSYVAHAIAEVVVDSPPIGLKDGGVIRPGYSEELDELRSIRTSGKEWIAGIEAKERESAGIPSLKVGYNKVFGYYIEVTKAHQDKIPPHYVRKQTLVNAERYITEDLKEYELKVLNAQERIAELEEEIFKRLRSQLIEIIPRIQATGASLATLDVIASLAEVAAQNGYTRPDVHDGDEIRISDARHPVVETFESRETFVPNDALLNRTRDQILIVTGPNMAGKSTYMRQTALLVIMAQMGSFVPAREASIGIVDRIFTRIGAADYLSFGQSTFMVEMNETAEILNNMSERSLVLLDEVGRGTSTFDGLSIAWAVVEYLHDRPDGGPRTLFATHYHELVEIAETRDRVRIYNVSVREEGDQVVFLRKIVPGGSSRSYGIQVARLAGIPDSVIDRAKGILIDLERQEIAHPASAKDTPPEKPPALRPDRAIQSHLFGDPGDEVLRELVDLQPEGMTPIEALNKIAEWKDKYT